MDSERPRLQVLKRRKRWSAAAWAIGICLLGAFSCAKPAEPQRSIALAAIPDQDPELLQRHHGRLADYLSRTLGVEVDYRPVTDYRAAVTAFRTGDLDLVWFGGLTGVQARHQVPGAEAILQRDIDERFQSVFIANSSTDIEALGQLRGHRFTFGSESSTSGRLMPQYYLDQAGILPSDFKGLVGYSGSHDKTIALVAAGTFDAGALNRQVWLQRVADGAVDTSRVKVIWTTPPYHDYHWVLHPQVVERFGPEIKERIVAAFTALSAENPAQAEILRFFGAERMIRTNNANYGEIEAVGRSLGLLRVPASPSASLKPGSTSGG